MTFVTGLKQVLGLTIVDNNYKAMVLYSIQGTVALPRLNFVLVPGMKDTLCKVRIVKSTEHLIKQIKQTRWV